MKRFTSLMLMLLVAVTTWAQASIEVSTAENPQWYTIGSYNRGGYLTNVGIGNGVQHVESTSGSLWYFEKANDNGGVYIVNNLKDGDSKVYLDSDLKVSKNSAVWYILSNGVNEEGFSISKTNPISNYSCIDANNHNTGVGTWHPSGNDWEGTTWSFNKVTDFTTVIKIDAIKAAAIETLDNIKGVTVLFNAEKITAAISAVNAVEAKSNSLEDLNAAVESVNAIVANIYTENFTNKNVRFTTQERGVADITAVAAGGAAQNNSGDAGIWTLKAVKGGFKMYNFASNLWLGATRGQSQRVLTVENEDDAALYVVNSRNGNEINLWNNGNTLHVDGSKNLVQWNDNAAGGGIFVIAEEGEISVTRDVYVNANAAKTTLPYAIQQAYGLVTDANNYFSNYKSTAEGSYEALLDNVETTYFHSSYAEADLAQDIPAHYIQADLGEDNTVGAFYFYMKPRSGNGNNRPVNIKVSGSNDNKDFTELATVTTTLNSSMTPYLSPVCGDDMKKYRYIRLTVTSTNSSTKFFTLSELYFFPATVDVKKLANAYSNLASTSITSADYATYANALVNAETTLALANIKKEIAALISANENNHATTPALSQYTTAAYEALVAAYNADDATQESLEAAIAAFNKSRNVPVYFIRSAHNGYAAGSAIYYDGAWKWKAANKYDKQMWMTIPAYAQENVPVVDAYNSEGTSYEICDYLTGTVMRGKSVQIVKIDGLDNAYNLQYNADANSTDAAQHAKDNGQLVNWKPGTANDALASAWYVDYLGTSYELDKLTDDKIAALAALQAAYNAKAVYANAEMGEGLGQYKGNKEAIVTALAAAEVIGSKTLAQQATLNIADINAATEALNNAAALVINMPAAGKYYRIQGACEAAEGYENFYITGHTNADGGRIALTKEADASTIYYFDGTNLIAYESGLVIGLNNAHWTFASIDDNSKPASTITFAQSPRTAGAYTVKSADRYLHYFYYSVNNTVQVNRCENDVCNEHDWYLTEVTELPVTVTAAGYATFFAPVAVTVPAGVTAHTVTINGEWATLSDALTVVPANTGVVLVGEGSYDFAVTTADAFEGTNLMAGTVAKTLVTKAANTECYVLANGKEGVGLYAAVKGEDATKFYNAGHKAYLAVKGAEGIASYSFRFGEGTTGVENVVVENEVKAIYDLTGRRVENISAPGIYIVNGVKKLVR